MGAGLLVTDGYKFSMAEAGWPLRDETFSSTHRRGGLQVVPFDLERELRSVLPQATPADWAFLAGCEYEMGAGFKAAIAQAGQVRVRALPRFSVFFDREPLFTVSGPSAVVSWLEPLVLMWSYRIQVATVACFRPDELAAAVGTVTCERQRQLVLETLDAVGVKAPPITVDSEGYVARVTARVKELVEVVGTPARLFEVGLRAASCVEQHLLALEGCKAAGLTRTSNVAGAKTLGLTPVGTMGHEHVQRYGSDEAAFRAMVERRPNRSSFLLDTFDTIRSGIPTAYRIIAERPGAHDSIRFDSGDKEAQYRHAVKAAREQGLTPVMILEDGFDTAQTRRFEALRQEVGWPAEAQVYGYGGFLVGQTASTPLTRDRVSAVYKLTQTGARPCMKFGNEAGAGKQSIPGQPVVWRRLPGASGPFGIVAQHGEPVPSGYRLLTGSEAASSVDVQAALAVRSEDLRLVHSPATQALIDQLTREAFG
ncbi:MAG: nicotinate phosphoribosyltransferase [Myxococcaceae bacterium]|jgi:nicotinic acid phosphoribosyltransferase|nr:nicotinate phosphoribosyltransferase [Myxococcaceae bacterium]